jgi:hypothetical protein
LHQRLEVGSPNLGCCQRGAPGKFGGRR